MIVDLLQVIVDYSKLNDQIVCTQIDKYLYDNMNIYSLKCPSKMEQNTIKQQKFCKLKILDCSKNRKIGNIHHLANTLEDLSCGYNCGINQKEISRLKNVKISKC